MHIDFAPPSNGTYNNAGSSRQLVNYLEHEDLERMEKGIYIEGFFNLTEDNIYKSKVIKGIDSNIGQLLKTDAKFYAIHVSPSEKELRAMGNSEQEQAEAMKHYIREVFIPEYAKNFNKGLSKADIKFYGKIHFSRDRSNNELNMYCHLIVSRKDQSNKKKLSPLTNHKNTKKGTIKGGFDRKNLFLQVEQGFDRLFGYNRQLTETFEYYNIMRYGSISEQLKMQEPEYINTHIRVNVQIDNQTNICTAKQTDNSTVQQSNIQMSNLPNISTNMGINSVSGIFTSEPNLEGLQQLTIPKKKKKKPKKGFRR